MEKIARKSSTDPAQETLRESKSVWNKEVSVFVNDLIHFKKLMNGWPSKFHMERSFIKEQIPADPATIIGTLANDFQEIAQKSSVIIQKQLDYSKTRRKKQPKQLSLPLGDSEPTTPTSPDLSKQLSLPLAASEYYDLVSEASNPITRFFTRILTPTFGVSKEAMIRKFRMSLLDACVKTYKDLGKLQVEVLKSSKDSLPNSSKLLHNAWNDWMLVNNGFATFKLNMPGNVGNAGGNIKSPIEKDEDISPPASDKTPISGDYDYEPPPGSEVEEPEDISPQLLSVINNISSDYKAILSSGKIELIAPDILIFKKLLDALKEFKAPFNTNKKISADKVIKAHSSLVNLLNKNNGTLGNNFQEILKLVIAKKSANIALKSELINFQIEKVAQDFLKKWIGKKRHEYSVFDKTSIFRLDVNKIAIEMRKNINEIMNLLEKGMNADELEPLILQANRNMTSLRKIMRALNNSEKMPFVEQI